MAMHLFKNKPLPRIGIRLYVKGRVLCIREDAWPMAVESVEASGGHIYGPSPDFDRWPAVEVRFDFDFDPSRAATLLNELSAYCHSNIKA